MPKEEERKWNSRTFRTLLNTELYKFFNGNFENGKSSVDSVLLWSCKLFLKRNCNLAVSIDLWDFVVNLAYTKDRFLYSLCRVREGISEIVCTSCPFARDRAHRRRCPVDGVRFPPAPEWVPLVWGAAAPRLAPTTTMAAATIHGPWARATIRAAVLEAAMAAIRAPIPASTAHAKASTVVAGAAVVLVGVARQAATIQMVMEAAIATITSNIISLISRLQAAAHPLLHAHPEAAPPHPTRTQLKAIIETAATTNCTSCRLPQAITRITTTS